MRPLLLACVLSLAATAAFADQIQLVNGRMINGRIVSRSAENVVVESNGVLMRINARSVKAIKEAPAHENTLLQAEDTFRRRDALRAIPLVFQALKQGAPKDRVRELIATNSSGIGGTIHRATPSQKAELRLALRELMTQDLLTTRTLYLTSQHFYQLEDYEAAAAALEKIPQEDVQNDPKVRTWALELMRFFVKRQLSRGEFEGALAYVEKMRRLAGDSIEPSLPLAELSRAAAARDAENYPLAFQIIAESLHPTVPEIARNRALYTISGLRRWAERTHDFAGARKAMDPIEKLLPLEYESARDHFLVLEASDMMKNGQSRAANDLLATIPERDRAGDVLKLYNDSYHDARMKEIPENEPLELIKHARWLMAQSMMDQAMAILARTRENPNLREISDELAATARLERDTKLLEEAQGLFELGQMAAVIEKTDPIISNPGAKSALTEEAERLKKLATESLSRGEKLRPYQAEVLYQEAERSYYMEELQKSFDTLNVVLSQFPETPAAGRAAALLPDVVRMMEIAYLEGKDVRLPNVDAKFKLEDIQQKDKLDEEVNRLLEAVKTEL